MRGCGGGGGEGWVGVEEVRRVEREDGVVAVVVVLGRGVLVKVRGLEGRGGGVA